MDGLGQPLLKALLVHEEHLSPALHPNLTCTWWPCVDHHVVDTLLGGWYKCDAGRLRGNVAHSFQHHCPVLSGGTINRRKDAKSKKTHLGKVLYHLYSTSPSGHSIFGFARGAWASVRSELLRRRMSPSNINSGKSSSVSSSFTVYHDTLLKSFQNLPGCQ